MRIDIFSLLIVFTVVFSCDQTSFSAERTVFQIGPESAGQFLIHDYANRWVEFGDFKEKFIFVEMERSEEAIELKDVGRNVGLKIYSDHVDLLYSGAKTWTAWEKGAWIGVKDLPKTITFVPTDQKIRLVYFVPADRTPIENYVHKIRVVMNLVAEVIRPDLKANGIRSDGFTLESNSDGEPVVHLVQTDKTAKFYNGAPTFDHGPHFQKIRSDIPASIGTPYRHMIVVFAETYEPGPAPIEWDGSMGRGNHTTTDGGIAVMSSWILRDEFCATDDKRQHELILDATPIQGRTSSGTKKLNSPRFEFIEDGFGAVVHEVGHMLGLPHDYRSANDIMGHGFRGIQANFRSSIDRKKTAVFSRDNARLLSVSRYLVSDVDLTDNLPPTADFSARFVKGATPAIQVSLKGVDDRALKAVVFYDPQNDTVIGGHELKGKEDSVQKKLTVTKPKQANKSGEYKLVAMLADQGGNIASIEAVVTVP